MNAVRGRAGRLAVIGALFGMVAALVAPHLGDVTAGPVDTDPVETTIPAEPAGGPDTSVVEAEPTATTEVEVTTPVEDTTPETTVVDTTPESTVVDTTPESTAVESTVPEPTGPFPTIALAPKPDDEGPTTTEPEGVIGLAAPGDVTVEAVCDTGFRPAIHITSLSTANIRVSVGRNAFELAPFDEVHLEWPMIEGDPPTLDPAPKWDAVDLDAIPPEVFDEGILSLPTGCPPTDVPSAPRDMASVAGNATVTLSWSEPDFDGGSDITDYTIEHNLAPFEDDAWTLVDDGFGTVTSFDVTGLTNGETYLFRIRAVNATGPGVAIEAKDSPNVPPSAPTPLDVVPTGRGRLLITWGAPTAGAPFSGYRVERSLDGASFAPLTEVGGDTTSFIDTGLTRPQRYYYRVTASNSLGEGSTSVVDSGVPYDVPTAARSVTAAPSNASGEVRLTWAAPLSNGGLPIEDYVILRFQSGGSTWVTINDGVNTNTSFVVKGLTNGVRYYFIVRARSDVGDSVNSNTANAIPRTVPTAPRSLTAAATGVAGQIRLSWYAPISNGGSAITDYIVYRSLNGTSWTWVNDGVNTNTAYTVTGLATGTRYYFRVFARNAVGTSPPSNVPSAVPASFLTAPRSLTAAPTNRSGQVRLAWLAPLSNGGAAITDYIVQRSPNGWSSWTTITDGVNVNTAYTVTGLSNGVRYYFRVVARNARGYSPSSNVVNAIPRTVPTAPRSLAAVPSNGSGQVRLTWLAPASNGGSAITDYLIQRSTNGTSWTSISDGVNTATTLWVNGLTNGVRYYFRVYARNAAGWSPVSTVVSAIPRTVPGPPAYVRLAAFDWGFRLDWGNPVSTGGLPITGFLIQVFDPDAGVWINLFTARPTTRILEIDAPGEGCGAFRIATLNAVGRSAFLGPVVDCWP